MNGTLPTPIHERVRNGVDWIKRNKVRTLLLVSAVWLAIEIAGLAISVADLYSLRMNAPTTTALQSQRMSQANSKRPLRKQWVPYSSISPHLIHAVIVAEDGTFWAHDGFDWYEFQESLEKNFEEGRFARGASTITQQLIKNLYLSTAKSPTRKVKEWILTWFAEQILTKRRILELYLNEIEWGDRIYGAGAAARVYFGITVDSLSREQAARLAAVIPNPRRWNANGDSRYIRRRTGTILQRMEARGW